MRGWLEWESVNLGYHRLAAPCLEAPREQRAGKSEKEKEAGPNCTAGDVRFALPRQAVRGALAGWWAQWPPSNHGTHHHNLIADHCPSSQKRRKRLIILKSSLYMRQEIE